MTKHEKILLLEATIDVVNETVEYETVGKDTLENLLSWLRLTSFDSQVRLAPIVLSLCLSEKNIYKTLNSL